MKKIDYLLLLVCTVIMLSCGSNSSAPDSQVADDYLLFTQLEGDSTLYGLACDGCTDTILVFLPQNCISCDPDTLNVLNATRHHRIFGHPKVGDNVAVVRNSNDSTVADLVIDLEDLRGLWCYQVYPTLKDRADMAGMSEKKKLEQLSDSLREILATPREYGMQLQGDHSARPIGIRHINEDNDMVEYHQPKRFSQWMLLNGDLLLMESVIDSTGQHRLTGTDTVQFVMLTADSLMLQFKDGIRSYYRKE